MRHITSLFLLLGLAGSTACHFPSASFRHPLLDPYPRGGTVSTGTVATGTVAAGTVPTRAVSSGVVGSGHYGTAWSGPMRARLWYDRYSGRLSVDLSRRGYIAVFALDPRGAIDLLYPYGGAGRVLNAGRHSIGLGSWSHRLSSGAGWDYRRWDHRGRSGPIYLLLIASQRRFELHRFLGHSLPWLYGSGVALSPFDVADRIARQIVPGGGWDDWTLDYQAVWPGAEYRTGRRSHYSRVRCPDGTLLTVATEALHRGWFRCPDYDRRRPERVGTSRGVPPLTESLGKPARPRPAARPRGDAHPTGGRSVTPQTRPRPTARPRPEPSNPRSRPDARPATRPAPPPRADRPASRPERTTRTYRPRPRPEAAPRAPARPERTPRATRPRPRPAPTATRPAPAATRPAPAARAKPARRVTRPRPAAAPERPVRRPRPKPKPPAKKKKGGGGGG